MPTGHLLCDHDHDDGKRCFSIVWMLDDVQHAEHLFILLLLPNRTVCIDVALLMLVAEESFRLIVELILILNTPACKLLIDIRIVIPDLA
jgi:hypothetical protein